MRGEDAASHRDGGRPGHRVRRRRGVRRLPLARGRGRQRDGLLRQVQRLRPSGKDLRLYPSVQTRVCSCMLVCLFKNPFGFSE